MEYMSIYSILEYMSDFAAITNLNSIICNILVGILCATALLLNALGKSICLNANLRCLGNAEWREARKLASSRVVLGVPRTSIDSPDFYGLPGHVRLVVSEIVWVPVVVLA